MAKSIEEQQERFQALVEKRDKYSQEKIQLETRKQLATEERNRRLTELYEGFGVSSVEEAKKVLAELEAEIDKALTECEEALRAIEDKSNGSTGEV